MAGVSFYNFKNFDNRQKVITVRDGEVEKKYWAYSYMFELFLLSPSSSYNFICSQSTLNSNHLQLHSKSNNQLLIHNNLYFSLHNIYTYVDASFYVTQTTGIYISTFSCLFHHSRISIFNHLEFTKQLTLTSTSNLFRGACWIERELKEFFSLNIKNLLDSRRLLTDYMVDTKVSNNEYKTTSFDLITQDLYLV